MLSDPVKNPVSQSISYSLLNANKQTNLGLGAGVHDFSAWLSFLLHK